jgi:hypothetical protein
MPNLLTIAATQHNKQVSYVPGWDWSETITCLHKIINILQIHGNLAESLPRETLRAPKPVEDVRDIRPLLLQTKKRVRVFEPQPTAGQRPKRRKTPDEKATVEKEFSALAKKYNRCYGCGRYVPPEARAAHKRVCVRKKQVGWSTMGKVEAFGGRGENPNRFADQGGNEPGPSAPA